MKTYKIRITPLNENNKPYEIELTTDRLDWSMEQYQRNRDAFDWQVVDEN